MESARLNLWKKSEAYVYMILLQVGYTGMSIISSMAIKDGTSPRVVVVYRHAFAAICLAPIAFIYERRPRMTFSVFVKILVLGLLEPTINQNLYLVGMKLTTASFSAAMSNMLPAFSFLLAWMLRLEKVNLRRVHSLAKILGTVVTVGGALIMTLVTGPALTHRHHHENMSTSVAATSSQDPVKGAVMITVGCLCCAAFFNLQAITIEEYPAAMSLATFICLAGSIESAIYAIPVERHDLSAWALQFDWKLLASFYGGLVCSAIGFSVLGMIMRTKGPVFVTAFSPLCMIMVTIVSCLFLSEILYLGMFVGAIVIVIGLYLVLWGKSKDPTPNPSTGVEKEMEMTNTETVEIEDAKFNKCSRLVSVDSAVV